MVKAVMKRSVIWLVLCSLPVAVFAAMPELSPKTVRAIDDVLHNARRRELVMITGKVKRSFDLDNILLADDKSEIAVSLVEVRQDLRPGDAVAVVGRFDGRVSYRSNYGLLNAIDWAPLDDPQKFDALKAKYGVMASSVSAGAPDSPGTPSSPTVSPTSTEIERRLRALDELKAKNLITPDEYQEQRKRILNQL